MTYPNLSEQEARFLRLIEDGRTMTEIAAIFGISMSRVRKVVRSLRDKFDVEWVGELADAAQAARATAAVDDDDGSIHVEEVI